MPGDRILSWAIFTLVQRRLSGHFLLKLCIALLFQNLNPIIPTNLQPNSSEPLLNSSIAVQHFYSASFVIEKELLSSREKSAKGYVFPNAWTNTLFMQRKEGKRSSIILQKKIEVEKTFRNPFQRK